MQPTLEKIEHIKKSGFELDFGTVINSSLENYKKIALTIGALLLVLITVFTTFTIVVGGAAATSLGIEDAADFFERFNLSRYSPLTIALKFIFAVIGTALVAPLTAGLLKIVHNAENNSEFGFTTAFYYYTSSYGKDLFTAALIIAVFTNSVDVGVDLIMKYYESDTISLTFGLFNGLVGIMTVFTIPLIIFGQLSAIEAIKGSLTLVLKKFWPIVFLMLLGTFCSIAFGLMALCIGIFFTLPFMYSLQYIIYKNAIGFDQKENDSYVEIVE